MKPGEVSVVVPVFNMADQLEGCIEALLRQTLDEPFDVVVVDNGSEPPVEPRWGYKVRVVRHEPPGSYGARNAGVQESSGGIVAFTDADCRPSPTWLSVGVDVARRVSSIVAGRVSLACDTAPSVAERYEQLYAFPQGTYLDEGFGITANLFVPREAFETVGLFDARLRSGGDREFGLRAAASGFTTVYTPDAVVAHPARKSIGALVAKARRTAGGNAARARHDGGARRAALEAAKLLQPPIRNFRRILRNPDVGAVHTRVQVCGALMLIRVVTVLERWRVLAGGRPVR